MIIRVAGIWVFLIMVTFLITVSFVSAEPGTDLFVSGDYAGALAVFTQELNNVDGAAKAPVLNNLGTCSMAFGDPEKAAGYYKQAVEADPGYGRGWINLGVLRISQQRYADARTAFETAIRNDPCGKTKAVQYLQKILAMGVV